jgi:hypothetical protein
MLIAVFSLGLYQLAAVAAEHDLASSTAYGSDDRQLILDGDAISVFSIIENIFYVESRNCRLPRQSPTVAVDKRRQLTTALNSI